MSEPTNAEPLNVAEASDSQIPAWLLWFCSNDDTYWSDDDGPHCWVCGNKGTVATPPRLNSQHGADFIDIEGRRMTTAA